MIYERFEVIICLSKLSHQALIAGATKLIDAYSKYLGSSFPEELVQFSTFAKLRSCHTLSELALLLHNEDLADTFPGANIAVRISLTIAVFSSAGERSFTKLDRIKSLERSTMADIRLGALCLLSAESELLRKIQFDDLIRNFADAKCKKQNFL